MPVDQLLIQLDSVLALTEPFSPVFLKLSNLRTDIAAAAVEPEPWNDPNYVQMRYSDWLTEQDYSTAIGI